MYDRRNDYLRRRRDRRSRDYSRDYRRSRDRNYNSSRDYDSERYYDGPRFFDTRDYNYEDDQDYKKDLKHWIEKLKNKTRFSVSKDQVIQQAKTMGVRFDEYDDEEFYAVYLMHASDYPNLFNDYIMYIRMAKDWLEDDDLQISSGEKVCKYLYNIVLGED